MDIELDDALQIRGPERGSGYLLLSELPQEEEKSGAGGHAGPSRGCMGEGRY